MNAISVLLSLVAGIPALAANEELQYKPANEYCWVFVADKDGIQTDRKEVRFVLDPSTPSKEKFKLEFDVDSEVKAEVYADPSNYVLSLYKRGNKQRPLAGGSYRRTAELLDFNTSGFEVFTDKAQYHLACVTESYIE